MDRGWAHRYARRLVVTDFLIIVWAVVGAQLLRFGVTTDDEARVGSGFNLAISYTLITVILILAWTAMLSVFKTRAARVLGIGSSEYRLVTQATLWLFGLSAIVLFLFKIDIARAYVLIALPLGLVILVFTRWLWRQWLRAKRRAGQWSDRAVLVGSMESVTKLARELDRASSAGYLVVGAVVPRATASLLPGTTIPLGSDIETILPTMAQLRANTLIVASSDDLPGEKVRELSWGLEPGRQHLVLAPSLTDVGGPRIHMRPVAGLPLMHVETPQYEGAQAFAKRLFDLVGSGLAIVTLAIPMLVIAIIVKSTSPGPIFYRSERIGYHGRPFHMLKFRSMRDGANEELSSLLDAQGSSDRPLFKVKDDPRVTPVGRTMRRYSLDEIPQFFNVFGGSMSLVGPRPQVAAEVALYSDAAHRRLLLKPGISGLWQISGRSNLSWEDALRLDLYYVENWSIVGDVVILWRTLKAVMAKDGAV